MICSVEGCEKIIHSRGLCQMHYRRQQKTGDVGLAVSKHSMPMTKQFGRWTVVDRTGSKWLCRCVCGTERHVVRADLRSGKSKSCGCLARELASVRSRVENKTHGMEGSTEYRTWIDMRRRCHQPTRPDFKNYGARGISVCDQWRNGHATMTGFEVFLRDMGPRPSLAHTLDRVDNTGSYSPQNCRWSTRTQQERNKSTNRIIKIAGECMTVAEAAERYAMPVATLHTRLRRGMSGDEATAKTRTKPVSQQS